MVRNRTFVKSFGARCKKERDGSWTYSFEVEQFEQNGYFFFFEGILSNTREETVGFLDERKGKAEGRTFLIRRAAQNDIKRVFAIEQRAEYSSTTTEEQLIDRFTMFRDGFQVAKVEGEIVGYVTTLLWNPFEF